MKILVVATGFYDYGVALAGAFEKLGHQTKLVTMQMAPDDRKRRITNKIYKIRNRRIGKELLYVSPAEWQKEESKKVLEAYKAYAPNLLVSFPAYDLTNDVIRAMDGCKKAIWIYDGVGNIPGIYQKVQLYDAVFVFEKSDVITLQSHGIKSFFLPLYADERIYYNSKEKIKDIDISFVGKISEDRYSILTELVKYFPKLNMVFAGTYSRKIRLLQHILPSKRKELRIFTGENINPKKANELYNRSKICLNIHKSQSKYGGNMRLYETLASGSFQITDENEYIKDEFSDSVITFNDISDLKNKIDIYLTKEDERARIADIGYNKVMNNHLFINRAKFIIEKTMGDNA